MSSTTLVLVHISCVLVLASSSTTLCLMHSPSVPVLATVIQYDGASVCCTSARRVIHHVLKPRLLS